MDGVVSHLRSQAPQDPISWRAFIVLKCGRGLLQVRQRWQDLSVLLVNGLRFLRHRFLPSAPQPLWQVLDYRCHDLLPSRLFVLKMAEGVGSAPTSVVTDPVFETGAASLYLPAFRKLAARVGLAPTPNGLTGRRATFTPPGSREVDKWIVGFMD